MTGTIILSIFVILAILSFVLSVNNGDDGLAILCIFFSIVSCSVLIALLVGPRHYGDECVVNTTQEPLKVVYVQYHPFTANTCDDVVILPGQSKLLHNVNIVEKIKYKLDSLYK